MVKDNMKPTDRQLEKKKQGIIRKTINDDISTINTFRNLNITKRNHLETAG
jgi:hypothetical protein